LSGNGVILTGGSDYANFRVLEIAKGSAFTIVGSQTISTTSGVGTLDIAGVLHVADTLVTRGAGTVTGTVSGGTLEIGGGSDVFDAGSALTVGRLEVSAGGIAVLGKLSYSGNWTMLGGGVGIGSGGALTLTGASDTLSGNIGGPGALDIEGTAAVTTSVSDTAPITGAGTLEIENGGLASFNTGAHLSVKRVLVTGASAGVRTDVGLLIYAGSWTQSAGTLTVQAGNFRLTGAADAFSGTLAGAGLVELTGAGDTLKALTLSAKETEILASSVNLSGILDVTAVLSLSSPDVRISGTTAFTGGGAIQLSNLATNVIVGAATTSVLNNSDKIEGAGQLGGGQLVLTNEASGTILANGTVALVINTGAERFVNGGLVEAAGAGGLTIDVAVTNAGVLEARGGTLTVKGTVSGAGKVTIEGGEASFVSTFSQNVAFVTSGELALAQSQTYAATISGFSKTGATSLDLKDISFTGAKAIYSGTTASGVLTVTDGIHTAHIKLAGNYTTSTWTLSSDGHGGVIVVDPTPPAFAALAQAMAGFTAPSAPDLGQAPPRLVDSLPLVVGHGSATP
jgi:hypothetical protein